MDWKEWMLPQLQTLEKDGAYRRFLEIRKEAARSPEIWYDLAGRREKAVNFTSNDYLGMSVHPDVMACLQRVTEETGVGSGGTRNISGTTVYHRSLEQALANWHGKPAALLFTSAYMANLTTLQTLGRRLPELIFLSDEENHASLIEGMRSAPNKRCIFRHNDMAHLEELLANLPAAAPKLIVFESVYSMSGDRAPMREIVTLANRYGARTYVDEVHAVGLYGATGGGLSEALGLSEQIDIINGTLAKSVGVLGGYIASNDVTVDFIRSFGSGFIFSTSLPPALCAAAETSIAIIRKNHQLRKKTYHSVQTLRDILTEYDIPFMGQDTHITRLLIPGATRCRKLALELLHEHGVYVQPLNKPTVPEGKEGFRLIVTARHSEEHLDQLRRGLQAVGICEPTNMQVA
jgi:5-aminolevulinate synthase